MPANTFKVGEMLNQRFPLSKTWLNFDGSFTTEIYQKPVHFEDENGIFHNINTNLFDEADLEGYHGPVEKHGKEALKEAKKRARSAKKADKLDRDAFDFQGLHVPFEAKLPRNFKRGYGIKQGSDQLHFKPVGSSPARGHVDDEAKNIIHYQDAWNDSDVTLELMGDGIKETIILKSDRSPTTFSFEVSGALEDDLKTGVLKLAPAWLEDADGEKRDVEQTIRREGEETFVDLVADVTGLTYPIAIDPTIYMLETSNLGDSYVSSAQAATNYGASQELYVGKLTTTEAWNSYIKFDESTLPTGAIITYSLIRLYGTYVGSSAVTAQIKGKRVVTTWAEGTINFSNKPSAHDGETEILNAGATLGEFVSVNVTAGTQYHVTNGMATNHGYSIEEISGAANTLKAFASGEYSNAAQRPFLQVTYNMPPTTPTLISPNGGENWNSTHTVTWNPSTDTETGQSFLRYQIQLTLNNGSSWADIVSLTAQGVTSYTFDFINKAATSTAKIRIRAYDGTNYGAWDESNNVFTIVHNVAPTEPTNLTPFDTVVDVAMINRLAWKYNDPNGTDTQSKFDLQWRVQGSGLWSVTTQTTPNNYYDVPANAFPVGVIEWQVRAYDQNGLIGPYSSIMVFRVATKTATPTIITPASGATVGVANPIVTWSHPNQVEYTVSVGEVLNGNILWTENRISTSKEVTIDLDLRNGKTYRLYVYVKDSGGVLSNAATILFTVSYTPPALPFVTTTQDDKLGIATITVHNPTPTGTQPTTAYNELFRRESPSEVWVKIAVLPVNGVFKDYEPKPATGISYAVTAFGVNGTYVESDVKYLSDGIQVEQTQLLLVSDPTQVVTMKKGITLSKTNKTVSERMKFAGREYAMTIFGVQKDKDFEFSYLVSDYADVLAIEALVDAAETLLLRDNLGRKEYVTIDEVPIEEGTTHWTISLKPQKVYYVEGV